MSTISDVLTILVKEYKEAKEKQAKKEYYEGYYDGKKDLCYDLLRKLDRLDLIGEVKK